MSGIAIEAISSNASAAFTASAVSILPFVFLAKHDPVEAIREPFFETWAENTGGSGAIKLYIREIMALVAGHLDSPLWRVKQVSALTLADACEAIGKDIRDHLNVVMPLLMKGVGGRSWKGKEAVLKALVAVVENAKDAFSAADLDEVSRVSICACRRVNSRSLSVKPNDEMSITSVMRRLRWQNTFRHSRRQIYSPPLQKLLTRESRSSTMKMTAIYR